MFFRRFRNPGLVCAAHLPALPRVRMLMTVLTPSTVTTKDKAKPPSGTAAATKLLLSGLNLSQLGNSWPQAVVTETVLFVARAPLAATVGATTS